MKLEVTYADGSKVTVEIPDPEILALADNRAKQKAVSAAKKAEAGRGMATAVKVI